MDEERAILELLKENARLKAVVHRLEVHPDYEYATTTGAAMDGRDTTTTKKPTGCEGNRENEMGENYEYERWGADAPLIAAVDEIAEALSEYHGRKRLLETARRRKSGYVNDYEAEVDDAAERVRECLQRLKAGLKDYPDG